MCVDQKAALIYQVSHVRKPHLAIMDGVVSGSGGGLAIPGRYKVACETTAFVMPNTGMSIHSFIHWLHA